MASFFSETCPTICLRQAEQWCRLLQNCRIGTKQSGSTQLGGKPKPGGTRQVERMPVHDDIPYRVVE